MGESEVFFFNGFLKKQHMAATYLSCYLAFDVDLKSCEMLFQTDSNLLVPNKLLLLFYFFKQISYCCFQISWSQGTQLLSLENIILIWTNFTQQVAICALCPWTQILERCFSWVLFFNASILPWQLPLLLHIATHLSFQLVGKRKLTMRKDPLPVILAG